MGGVGVTIMQRLDEGMHSYPVIERNTHRAPRVSVANSNSPPPPSLSNHLRVTATVSSFRPSGDAYKVILAKFVSHVFRLHENFPSRKLPGWEHEPGD